jgi:class 3 adenylate cyclase
MTARHRSLPADGFMALFGAPLTHEDHVRRALLAAVAIQRALGENNEAAARQRLDLQVRIGIHTGPVVFGPIGDQLPMDYTAIGDTANVAARVQQAAEPGTILPLESAALSRRTPKARPWRPRARSASCGG